MLYSTSVQGFGFGLVSFFPLHSSEPEPAYGTSQHNSVLSVHNGKKNKIKWDFKAIQPVIMDDHWVTIQYLQIAIQTIIAQRVSTDSAPSGPASPTSLQLLNVPKSLS